MLCQLLTDWGTASWTNNKDWNAIVPINVYNVREGRINSSLTASTVYERGVTNVVEINMRNLARWLDGVYDNNLLAGTSAVSTNVASPDGYTVYVSDRRGDELHSGTTNGMVDNEDIYGSNGTNAEPCATHWLIRMAVTEAKMCRPQDSWSKTRMNFPIPWR